MPIRFHCSRCYQLLGIASRKAGSQIQCPKCGFEQTVPSEEAAAAALAMSSVAKHQAVVEDPSKLVVYEDEPTAIETPRPQRSERKSTSRTKKAAAASAESAADDPQAMPEEFVPGEPVPSGMILFPRRTFYVQAVLYIVIACFAFGMGFFLGRGQGWQEQLAEEEEAQRVAVLVEGTLLYDAGGGRLVGDEDAVIIILPEEEFPKRGKIPFDGIRPQDDATAESNKPIRMIEEIGGKYARADADGKFSIVLPDQGDYCLLLISKHATRSPNASVDAVEADLLEMKDYFEVPEHLISDSSYRWIRKRLDLSISPIEENLSVDAAG